MRNRVQQRLQILSGNGAEIHRRLAEIGHDVRLTAAADGADVMGWVAEHRVAMAGEIFRDFFAQKCQGVQNQGDGADSYVRGRGMDSPAVGAESQPNRAFVGVNGLQTSRLADDDEIEFFLRGQGLRTVLAGLFAHEPGEPDLVRERGQDVPTFTQSGEHRRHRALGVGCPPAPDPVGANFRGKGRNRHAEHADRIGMGRQQQAGFSCAIGGKTPDHIGPSGQDICDGSFRAQIFEKPRQKFRAVFLPDEFRAGMAIGVDARDADEFAKKINGGAHGFLRERYHSTNFGMPSEILTCGL